MAILMHSFSVGAYEAGLKALIHVIGKAKAHCEARKIDPEALTSARLYPDMFPFWRQICLATDFTKGPVARLAGVEVPAWEDKERTFDELLARLEKARAYLKEFGPDRLAGSESRQITIKMGGQDTTMTGEQYLAGFANPNFYFHVTTAYDILRHNGVEIGKRDFFGRG